MSFFKNVGDKGIKEGTLNEDPVEPKLFSRGKWISVPRGCANDRDQLWIPELKKWVGLSEYVAYSVTHMPARSGRGGGVFEEDKY